MAKNLAELIVNDEDLTKTTFYWKLFLDNLGHHLLIHDGDDKDDYHDGENDDYHDDDDSFCCGASGFAFWRQKQILASSLSKLK